MAPTPANDLSVKESLAASADHHDSELAAGPFSDRLGDHLIHLGPLHYLLRDGSALDSRDIRRVSTRWLLHRQLDAARTGLGQRREPSREQCAFCFDGDIVDPIWVDPNIYLVEVLWHRGLGLEAPPARPVKVGREAVTSEQADSCPQPAWLLNAFAAGYEHGLRDRASSGALTQEPPKTTFRDVYGIAHRHGRPHLGADVPDPSVLPKPRYVLSSPSSNKSALSSWLLDALNPTVGQIEDDLTSHLPLMSGSFTHSDRVKTSEPTATNEDDSVATAREHPHDPHGVILGRFADAFGRALADLLAADADLVTALAEHDPEDLAEQAAEQIVAPFLWARAVGDKFDTTQVTQILGISRQAVAKRVAGGSLLGIPGRGTTYFPAWQFDLERRAIKPEVSLIVEAFRESIAPLDPLTVASWATTEQTEDLDGSTPEEWILDGRDSEQLIEAAYRAAKRLSQ